MRVALDDFGTGFASLESLGGWPVNELKLDMSLVRPIASNASFRTIVRTTVDLAHQLGVKVVGEGVESEAVRSELQALGCDLGQGFLLGRPMAPAAFADWLRQREHPRRPIPAQAGLPVTEPVPGDRGSAGRPTPPSPNPGRGAAAGPATAVPPARAERQVPNGRARGPDAR